MTKEWHLVIPGRVCYGCESLRIHQIVHAAQDKPAPCQLEDDMEWKEIRGMDLCSGHLEPLQPIKPMKISLQCCGEENTKYFSHAYRYLWLQDGFQGSGEMWNFWWTEEEAVCTISCSGGEKNWWLVNREGTPTLSLRGDTKWLVSDRYEGRISISVFATDGCLVLSHADGQLALQSDYRGEGELWKLAA